MCWEEDGVRERVLGGGWGEGACVGRRMGRGSVCCCDASYIVVNY